uniref:Uncharacterized protein n=1 Tax=Rhizophagus irregularis (strain DAOM 181602 / DAOM 197198 / MUCL 43194) TaxID=747089 RepID=U9TNK4_RHIID
MSRRGNEEMAALNGKSSDGSFYMGQILPEKHYLLSRCLAEYQITSRSSLL